MTNNVIELTDVISRAEQLATDKKKHSEHSKAGTLDEYYSDILKQVIGDLALLPLNREFEGLEPLDEAVSVNDAVQEIVEIVAPLFSKPFRQVESDLVNTMGKFPIQDLRTATYLKHRNLLN